MNPSAWERQLKLILPLLRNGLKTAPRRIGQKRKTISAMRCKHWAGKKAILNRCRRLPKLIAPLLVAIGERENNTSKLKDAVSAFRVALEVEPTEAAPLDIARTQISLAYTLGALWNRTRNPKLLNEALNAVDAALRPLEEAGAREQMPEAELARETILAAMGRGTLDQAAA
jgi:hypothetical protein